MKLIPCLMFREGKCREAFAFYAQACVAKRISPRFGLFYDRYGQPWMVNCTQPQSKEN
ncbi:MAG: hypothetical protein QM599_09150 [Pseudoxanthomonas sp.]